MTVLWIFVGTVAALCVIVLGVLLVAAISLRRKEQATLRAMEQARTEFRQQREWLEARFFTMASESGRPRGLAWRECDFENDVAFARDKSNGELRALVSVNISFEAVEGGGMEDNPNVGRVRAATAVFLHRSGQWETDGRAIMNLDPEGAIKHFQNELETVD